MARQLRIEYPGAFYHVTSRGNQKQPIYEDDRDRSVFIDILGDLHQKSGASIHVYCLMGNHYHFLLETPKGNLSRIMHHLNTTYTIYFNNRHSRVGHLFQGRYKAILVEKDAYAQELSRYIHLNPVRSGITDSPESYEWSSYRSYLGRNSTPSWLNTDFILGYFGSIQIEARNRYSKFIAEAMGRLIEDPLKRAKPSSILGNKAFIARINKTCLSGKSEDREVPAIHRIQGEVSLEAIQQHVERTLGAKNKFARRVSVYITRKNTDHALKDIADYYQITMSGVGNIHRRMKKELGWNGVLLKNIEDIEKSLFVSGSRLLIAQKSAFE